MHAEMQARAATLLLQAWQAGQPIDALPKECRPRNLLEGYAIQTRLAALSKSTVVGWKIAATSSGGQKHIGVDGPLAGRLFADRVQPNGAQVGIRHNHMRVAEAEFAFRMTRDLPPRPQPYGVDEVMAAVGALYPAIELPDSRFLDFAQSGGPQLVADDACAFQFVLGEPGPDSWANIDLSQQMVRLTINTHVASHGSGADALGDPRLALTWIANNHAFQGEGLRANQMITTGVCGTPCAIAPGDIVVADFGGLGRVEVRLR